MRKTQHITGRRAIAGAIFSISFLLPAFAAAQGEQGTVANVVDGDTFKVEIDGSIETIRIIGIDTPETVHPSKPVQCFGKEASAKLKELLDGEDVTLEKNPAEDRDKYDRLLRYVNLGGEDIGASMIEEGFAYSYKQYPHPRLEEYNALEQEAREENRGLWGGCNGNSSGEFNDVPSSHSYIAAIRWGKASGVLSGYPDGTFQPDRTVNRAEFLKIVLAANDSDVSSASEPTGFRDVNEDAWYASYIRYAKSQGIVQGYPDGSFKPEQPVNFAEALKMAYVALSISGDTSASGAWYEPYLSHAKNNDVLFSNNVNVGTGMSRKDVVWIVWRLLDGTDTTDESVVPEPSSEPDEEEPSDSCEIKGNISGKKEKIYHVPGCKSYNATQIDESAGERWFCSEQEAVDAGWRRAENCE
ncbi:MAG: S-layer homology domain-containing protein [Candidatus Peribacteraceae bacterium]|nr:S-layer homology domain-containing protein [Candidatus Peribacteraceae bacterium]MDD5742313.1 S-layer homology domain-containing protein [Candidatus Peribacteraceae bacterium]